MEKLNENEIVYFYQLLDQFEHRKPSTYNNKQVKNALKGKIDIDVNYSCDSNIKGEELNKMKFVPYNGSMCLGSLSHIRNSFAHGNLYSVDGGKAFFIKDFSDKCKRSKCNMLGYIEKDKLYELIDIIKKHTKPNKRNKKQKTN